MANILIIRFSALGDVAMTVPVLYSLAKQYPQHHFIMLSRSFCQPLFEFMPPNFTFEGVDLNEYKGILGLGKLYRKVTNLGVDMVADLHGVLRSYYLDLRFFLSGKRVRTIKKGRSGKKCLTRRYNKMMLQQSTSFQRYKQVFGQLGMPFSIDFKSIFQDKTIDYTTIYETVGVKKEGDRWIGIAPFAAHAGKIYSIDNMEKVVDYFSSKTKTKVFLFGGGTKEKEVFHAWCSKYDNVISVAGLFKMDKELMLMSKLDTMVSMDSANMHLASLVGTRVVSIWGATHPYAGFMGWRQKSDDVVQIDMDCRPCSVYGQKPCFKGNYPCLGEITPEMIINKINTTIKR